MNTGKYKVTVVSDDNEKMVCLKTQSVDFVADSYVTHSYLMETETVKQAVTRALSFHESCVEERARQTERLHRFSHVQPMEAKP